MAKKGRPKGSNTRRCLIQDPLLTPWEIHVDESKGAKNFLLVNSETQVVNGYFTQLPYLIRAIIRKKHLPTKWDDTKLEVYSLKEYCTKMQELNDEMRSLLIPNWQKWNNQ